MRIKGLLALLTLAGFSSLSTTFSAYAEIIISGIVVNENKEPVDVATTRLVDASGKTRFFRSTDENGRFQFTIDTLKWNGSLLVECLGYAPASREISTDRSIRDITVALSQKATELKEVVVTAPNVRVLGDTVSYRLSAFAGKGDVTLKDAMRNLPGIDIADNGKIKYLGKDISNFYIEGMDLLGGKYNVATENLPVSSVTNVEILNNHQSVKMDKDIFSDNVAINIKLNSKAKFRPVGTYEAIAGYGDDWLYQLSGAGMMFSNKFQTILNLKYGNITEFSQTADTDLADSSDSPYSAGDLLGSSSLSTPPLSRDRFINPEDCFVSLNTLNKTGADGTFRANAGYSYSKATYSYLSLRDYFTDAGALHIDEQQSSHVSIHRPTLALEYKLNGDSQFLTNKFSAAAGFKDNDFPSVLDAVRFNQHEKLRDYSLRNEFRTSWRRSRLRWSISSLLEFNSAPKGEIDVQGHEPEESFLQSAKSCSFLTKETLSAAYEYKRSRLWMPLSILYSHNRLQSSLDSPLAENDAREDNLRLWFAPQYEYTHPQRKYVFRGTAILQWQFQRMRNLGSSPLSDTFNHFTISPNAYFYWKISGSSSFRTQIVYSDRMGDIADFLSAPVRTDNLDISYATGILSRKKSFNAMMHYDFKIPLEMWFLNADIIYDNTRSNLLSNSNVTGDYILSSPLFSPNTLETVTGLLNITKQFTSINTKISLGGSYMCGRGDIAQDEVIRRQYTGSYSFSGSIIAKPWSFLEFIYKGKMTRSRMKFEGIRNSLLSQTHTLGLSLFPFKGFEVRTGCDITRKELTRDISKTMALMDAGVAYKFSSFRVGVDVRNILDTRHYSYSIFSGINQFSYDYALRGRQILLTFSFTR